MLVFYLVLEDLNCDPTSLPYAYRARLTVNPVTGQIQEMEMIRQKVYQLEQAQIKIKAEYVHRSLSSNTILY